MRGCEDGSARYPWAAFAMQDAFPGPGDTITCNFQFGKSRKWLIERPTEADHATSGSEVELSIKYIGNGPVFVEDISAARERGVQRRREMPRVERLNPHQACLEILQCMAIIPVAARVNAE